MPRLNDILKKYALKPHRYEKSGKVTFIDTEEGRFVIKENNRNRSIYEYLDSRSFNYFPMIISDFDDDYEVTEYISDINVPREQKILDMIDLVSLLHNKTTHYKEVDVADYKKIYEDINNNIAYLFSYYSDLITLIETKVFMSPAEYLLARNIYKVYASLEFCQGEIERWYELVKDKKKQRSVVLHNNLDLSHFIRNKTSYLISWDKAKVDLPLFDIYKLYRHHGIDFEFSEILRNYEKHYPLFEEERKLLFILIMMPDKIEFDDTEYNMTRKISKMLDLVFKTEIFISPYYSKDAPKNKNPENKT